MRGRFVCNTCSPPRGAKAPRGTVITLEIESATMFGFGFGMGDRYPDLKRLGTAVRLSPPPKRRKT
jgi:hypothetical protein